MADDAEDERLPDAGRRRRAPARVGKDEPSEANDLLPPFGSLRVFEAAARLGSLARASEAFGISPGAVSQHVRLLEEFAGQPLFRRLGRGVELTDAGKAALAHANIALTELLQAGRAMRASFRGRRVSLSAAPSFASKWLVPRLGHFQEAYPDIEVRLTADITLTDFTGSDVDFAIRYGPGGYEGLYCERLMAEAVVVVCSPRMIDPARPLRTAADLSSLPLIHDDSPDRDPVCPNWNMWFAARGIRHKDPERGLRFNQSGLAIEAAIEGKGLILAKRQLARRDLTSGALVAPLQENEAPVSFAYWLVWPRGRRFDASQVVFLEWLRGQVAEGDPRAYQTA